jgi:hypothetical protein
MKCHSSSSVSQFGHFTQRFLGIIFPKIALTRSGERGEWPPTDWVLLTASSRTDPVDAGSVDSAARMRPVRHGGGQ